MVSVKDTMDGDTVMQVSLHLNNILFFQSSNYFVQSWIDKRKNKYALHINFDTHVLSIQINIDTLQSCNIASS